MLDSFIHDIFKLEVHASLRAEELFRIGPLGFTNSTLMAWAAMLVLGVFAYFAGRKPQLVPRGAQNALESILEALLTLVENTAGHYSRRVFPLIATLFLFIITANYMGMMPGVGTIFVANPRAAQEPGAAVGHAFVKVAEAADLHTEQKPASTSGEAKAHKEPARIPLLRAANADVNMTLGMGLTAFAFIHASGIIVHGLKGYWVNELANPPLMTPVKLVIESFVPISLSMRLFGNIFGGEMLLTVMAFPFVAVPFMIMELLFGLIQAIIFSMLTLIFTSLASHLPEGHGDVHGARDAGSRGPAHTAPAHA